MIVRKLDAYAYCILSIIAISSCNGKTSNKVTENNSMNPSSTKSNPSSNKSSNDCDPNLWKYVYNSERLQVLDKCKSVTGTIVESNADEDGDQHMLLNLDKGQENLLTERNMKKKEGNLVIEAICINNITRNKALGACDGFVNNVQLPKVGDHVNVTGSYVIDSHNGWAEIHPITKVSIQ